MPFTYRVQATYVYPGSHYFYAGLPSGAWSMERNKLSGYAEELGTFAINITVINPKDTGGFSTTGTLLLTVIFNVASVATRSPFDPATFANWGAGGTAWSADTAVSHDGSVSAKAQTTNSQSTYQEYTVTGPAVVDFWWKVSSEQIYDTFSYSLDGASQETISGEVDWTYRTLTLPAGIHTIRWTYAKDASAAVGQDAGWLDDFVVHPATATLRVLDGATVLSGASSVDFGSAVVGSKGFAKSLTFANEGYVPLEVQLSLPNDSPFAFEDGSQTYDLLLGRGESLIVPFIMSTAGVGSKSSLLSITAPDSSSTLPSITLTGTSKLYLSIPQGIVDGSVATSGTGGANGWDFAVTPLPSGQNGEALKSGTTPDTADSALEFVTQTAGVVSWSWKVGCQENFDWLLCEVDGQNVAGISTKNGAWQTQAVQVPAGANIRWVYRKDASASAGEDAGYLADVAFRGFAGNTSFGPWAQSHGIAEPQRRIPKSGIMNMFSWLGGFDPAVGPDSTHYVPFIEGGRLKYRFPISKTADGTQQVLFSSDMNSWTARRFSQRVLSEDANAMVIEATAPSGTKGFFKVVGTGDTSMVEVQGGTLPQTSGLAGTAVATFRIGTTEVTWGEWQEVRAWAVANGYTDLAGIGAGTAPEHPVHSVSWYDVVKWCNAKSEMAGLTPCYQAGGAIYRTGKSAPTVNSSANGYRLPTEAEWEWAARGGVRSQGYGYSGGDTVDEVAWYNGNSSGSTKNVGTKKANELGLYDMSGNVWEWYEEFNRGGIRGGGYSNVYQECTVGLRGSFDVGATNPNIGFRVSRNSE